MSHVKLFSDQQLQKIIGEGLIYMCACPAQVAQAVLTMRELHRYQLACIDDPENVSIVHQTIAAAALLAHNLLEDCMDRVLELEQWDRNTLEMPAGLRVRQSLEIERN